MFERGARAAVDVRGGAPGTRESAALDPLNLIPSIHGLLLTGGSAFGLDAAGGVVRWLEERGIGFLTPAAVVPIVPAAVIYDLRLGDPRRRPDAAMGYAAAEAAREGALAAEGNAGAGTGATVGKALGADGLMKGGIGMASARAGPGWRVGAIAVVNAFGDVVDPASGAIIAGCRAAEPGPGGSGGGRFRFADSVALLAGRGVRPYAPSAAAENTTLVAIVTDAPLSKVGLARVARTAHDGFARAIRPVHTIFDGDDAYAVSVAADEDRTHDPTPVEVAAAEVVAAAIVRAVRRARSVPGAPAVSEGEGRP